MLTVNATVKKKKEEEEEASVHLSLSCPVSTLQFSLVSIDLVHSQSIYLSVVFFTTICFDFFLVTVRVGWFFCLLFFSFCLRFLVVFVVVAATVVFVRSYLLFTVS